MFVDVEEIGGVRVVSEGDGLSNVTEMSSIGKTPVRSEAKRLEWDRER
jgi:hypothetical protein